MKEIDKKPSSMKNFIKKIAFISLLVALPILSISQEMHFKFEDDSYTKRMSKRMELYVMCSNSLFKLVRLSDSTFLLPYIPPEIYLELQQKNEIEVKMVFGNRCFITAFPNFIENKHRSVHLRLYRGNKKRLWLYVSQSGKGFIPMVFWCHEYMGQYKDGLVEPDKLFMPH